MQRATGAARVFCSYGILSLALFRPSLPSPSPPSPPRPPPSVTTLSGTVSVTRTQNLASTPWAAVPAG